MAVVITITESMKALEWLVQCLQ